MAATEPQASLAALDLPAFNGLDAEVDGVIDALDTVLAENLELLDRIGMIAGVAPGSGAGAGAGAGSEEAPVSWASVIEPLEAASDRVARLWSPIRHLHAVADSDALRAVYDAGLPRLTDYGNRFGQHQGLYGAYRALADSGDFPRWPVARRTAIEQALRDFRLSGIDLDAEAQSRYREISQRLSELSNRFSQNLMDATDAWSLQVPVERLAGLPESARDKALAEARERKLDGAVLTLDGPTYMVVMSHAEDRDLRRSVYRAWVTRASDQSEAAEGEDGESAEDRDNGPLIVEMLALRDEQARLLGFASWAERQLDGRMAETPAKVLAFLDDLAQRSVPQARREFEELKAFAAAELALPELEAWDLGFASERLRQARYDVSQEALRPWFPVDRVISGLFEIVQRLFGIRVVERDDWSTWHASVRCYEVLRSDGETAGCFYLDLYARRHKRGGAWMDGCRGRRLTAAGVQVPVAFLTCNFAGPVEREDGGRTPALLTHDEVTTLFHEFGHGLHHMLTRVDVADVAGINGVPWDAVELPSQFLENWCWHPQAVALISAHHETGEPLPAELLERLLAARNFQSAMMMVRQLEFSLLDFRLHHDYQPGVDDLVRSTVADVRASVAVVPAPAFNRFENGFGHVFAGGYSAGYYSYKWAEILSADAFSRFEEEGIFDARAGEDFLTQVLERGGSEAPGELFRRFRGRDPEIGALLRHSGILAPAAGSRQA